MRSTLDNLANAALLAAEVEQEELEAAAAAPPPSRAGKTSVRTVARRPNKKPRSGSATSSPGSSPNAPAEGQPLGHTVDRPLSASASQSKLTAAGSAECEHSQGRDKTASAVALTSPETETDAVMHASHSQQSFNPESMLVTQGMSVEALPVTDVFDPIAAAIKNATEAITTDGAMQASMPMDIGIDLEDIGPPEQGTSDNMALQIAPEAVAAYLDPVPPQQLPAELQLQVSQMPGDSPADHLTLEGQSGTVTYPVASDGTVTITTSHPAAAAPGATMMVQQPEGLLYVRDPATGKERCLGKLLGNSKQTSLILQAANFLEPCSI